MPSRICRIPSSSGVAASGISACACHSKRGCTHCEQCGAGDDRARVLRQDERSWKRVSLLRYIGARGVLFIVDSAGYWGIVADHGSERSYGNRRRLPGV